MQTRFEKKTWKSIKIILLIYILAGCTLYFVQDLLLFHPTPLSADHKFAFANEYKEHNIHLSDRNLNIIQFPSRVFAKGIVLYFHGNMQNIERYAKFITPFVDKSYEVWMVDYPGFGKSTGQLTEENINADAMLVYNMALKTKSENIIIYGKSIGTGVASYLASIKPCQQLILETPYYSIPELAQARVIVYPTALLTRYKFPIHEYLHKVKARVTIFHGTDDGVIPYKHAMRLKNENQSIEFITIEGGSHNNLYQYELYQKKLDSLISN
jgi:pimeloyl-ACP methyl ester carboxylesterase